MMLYDGMLLYHGSYIPVETIDLSRCTEGKDFGKGFHMTSSLNQARNFLPTALLKAKSRGEISGNQNWGYVSTYRVELNEAVRLYEFPQSSRQWLWFISQNRREKFAQALKPLIDRQVFEAEIIFGKVANDKTNPVITTYLNGLYGEITSDRAIKFAIEELMPDHLEDQFCFISERAIACLKFREANRYVVG